MRSIVLCRLSLVLLALTPALALADMQYSVTPISGLGGTLTVGTGLNDSGQVVGNSSLADGSTHAFLFDGQIHDLGTFGGVNSFAYGINNSGDMALVSVVKNPDNTFARDGIRYQNAVATNVGGVNTIHLNNAKQYTYEQTVNGTSHAFLYSNGVAQDINSFGNSSTSFSWGISDAGHVNMESGSPHWLLYYNNSTTPIVDPDDHGANTNLTLPKAVNAAGDVVGSYANANFKQQGFLYHNGTYTSLPEITPHADSVALAFGPNGWILGYSNPPFGQSGEILQAAVWHDGQVFNLNDLISPEDAQKYHLTEAIAMNSEGQILANNGDPTGDSTTTFLLTPINTPEPGSLALIFAAAMPLLLRRSRA
jgi:probable HAF family extracellular repeat protein